MRCSAAKAATAANRKVLPGHPTAPALQEKQGQRKAVWAAFDAFALISRFHGACGIVSGLIVACTSCSAQYTLADAKVRGRKVRATCKHCGTSFVIDGTEKAPAPLSLPNLETLMGGSDASDDATRVAARPDFSVHDEQTVVGQIPAAALEAERRYAQRTLPPPANEPAPPTGSVPAAPAAKPFAPVAERTLPPYSSEPTLLIPTPLAAASRPTSPSPEPVLLSADELQPERPLTSKRPLYLLLALAMTLAVAVAVVLTMR